MDKVTLIKEDEEVIGFRINDKEFFVDETGCAEVQVSELEGFNIGSIPQDFCLMPLEGNMIIFEGEISSSDKYPGIARMNIHIYRKYWDHKFGASQYVEAMKEAVEARKKTDGNVQFDEIEDDGAHIFFRYKIFLLEDMLVGKAFKRFREIVEEIEGHTERILEKAEISKECLEDEKRFSIEVLLPLLRSMGFLDVKYNHGKREFGKDITFSETDKFGVRRNYGIQVKAGDLSGEVGSELDKIIGQIEDAFSMPYIEITSREKRWISDLVIVVSGRFTDNAKDKIVEKVGRRNIYFFDIDKVQELLTKYMR